MYRLIHMAKKEVTGTQCPIITGQIRFTRVEPDCSFDVGDSRLWPAQKHKRLAKLVKRTCIIVVEHYRRLQFDMRFATSPSNGSSKFSSISCVGFVLMQTNSGKCNDRSSKIWLIFGRNFKWVSSA